MLQRAAYTRSVAVPSRASGRRALRRASETHDEALAHVAAALRWHTDALAARFAACYAFVLEYVSSPSNPNAWTGCMDPIAEVCLVDPEMPAKGTPLARLIDAVSGRFAETVRLDDDTPLGFAVSGMPADGEEPGELVVRGLHYDPVSGTLSFDEREALVGRFIAQGQNVVELETERLAELRYGSVPCGVRSVPEGTRCAGAILARMRERLPAAACLHERARIFVDAGELVRLALALGELNAPR